MKITEIFDKINSSVGNDKTVVMQQNLNDVIVQMYQDCYDPDRKYGLHKLNITATGTKTVDDDYDEFHDLLDTLAEKELTGNAAIDTASALINQFTQQDQSLLKDILNKKFTIGFSAKSLEKLINKPLFDKFVVTLACHLEKVKGVNPIDGTWFASRKCDGCRCVAFLQKHAGSVDVDFISRQGKQFLTLDKIKPALRWLIRDEADGNYYVDGECCIVDENGNEDFQSILKEIRRKDHTIENPCYQIFDFITEDEFNLKTVSPKFDYRYSRMVRMARGCQYPTLKVLKQELLLSQDDFDRWEHYVAEGHWEGFMLRKNEEFKKDRIKTLLKVKKFQDAEYVVSDLEVAELTAAEPGVGNIKYMGVKSLIITHKGNKVNVGSGLSKEQRMQWYAHPEQIIGKTITVKFFEITTNKDGQESLRFPTLKCVYEHGRDI